MSTPQARSAIKFDLFADAARKRKIETLGDPLQIITRHIDFAHLARVVDQLLPRGDTSKGGRPPYPTEVMVRILVLKHLYNLSDEQAEYQLLDRMSYQRFCLLTDSVNIPDRNTIWHYQQRLGADGAAALFQALDGQLLRHGYLARCGQIIDATLVPAPIGHFTTADKEQLGQGNIPSDWSEAKRRQKDLDATHTKKHGKGYHGYNLLLPSLQTGLDPKSVQYNLPGFGNAERTSLVFNRTPSASEEGWYATVYAEDFKRTRAITTSTTQHTVGKDDRRIFGGRLAQNLSLNDKSAVIFGVDMRYDEGDAFRQQYQYNLPTANYINNQGLQLLTYGLFAQGQYKIVPSLKLTGGLRYDRFDYSINNRKLPAASTDYTGSVFTPKYGAVWTVSPAFELFANVAQGFRSPAAEQISSSGSLGPLNATGGVISNSIKPTKVKSYDTGFTSKPLNNWTLGGAVYYTLNEDEIVNTAPDVYQSVGDTTRKGFELETRYHFNDAASVYLNYGRIITARINNPTPGTGAMLSVPRHTYKGGGEYKTAMGPGKLTTNFDVYVTDGNPFYSGTPSTSKDMPVYTRYDFKATYDYRQWQASLFYILQPHEFGSDIAYGTTAGLLLSPMPKHQFGASLRYFF